MVKAGQVAIVPKGEFVLGTLYTRLDLVTYEGSAYIAKKDNVSILPTDEKNWMLVVTSTAVMVDDKTIEINERGILHVIGFVSEGEKGVAGGVASLGNKGKVPDEQLPEFAKVAKTGSYNDLSDNPTNATTSKAGLMSSEDKKKLNDLVAEGTVIWSGSQRVPARSSSSGIASFSNCLTLNKVSANYAKIEIDLFTMDNTVLDSDEDYSMSTITLTRRSPIGEIGDYYWWSDGNNGKMFRGSVVVASDKMDGSIYTASFFIYNTKVYCGCNASNSLYIKEIRGYK